MNRQATATASLLERVLIAFDAADVRWALLRGKIGGRVAGHDVDLLIAGDDVGAAEDVVFAMGGVALPKGMRPWHRFYMLQDPETGERVVLDVVSELIYGPWLQIESGLEAGCLDRRRRDGAFWVLDPTDMFWTVLLHCLLDKGGVAERRRTELGEVVRRVVRPSAVEDFFERLGPPGWSADRALEAVAAQDWDALEELGQLMYSSPDLTSEPVSAVGFALSGDSAPAPERRTAPAVAASRRMARRAAETIYPTLWRAAGLGVMPHILDVADLASVDLILVSRRRSPGFCEVVLLVADEQRQRLVAAMQEHHYRLARGGWHRVTHLGLERIETLSPSQLALPGPAWEDLRLASSPIPGRIHSRRSSAGTSLLIAAMAVAAGHPGGSTTGQSHALSSQAWAEAQGIAAKHGLLPHLELLIQDRGTIMNIAEQARGSRSGASRKPRHRGVRVSFSGLDGAGKTRQIDALAAAVGEQHSVEVLWLPTKVWPEPLLNQLPASLRSRLGPKRSTVAIEPIEPDTGVEGRGSTQRAPATKGSGGVVDALRSATWLTIATFAATSVGLSLRRRASKSSADLLVLDRYRLDSLVKLQYWYPDVSGAWLCRVVGALAPAPDVEFLLRVDPAVAHARKPEQWSVKQLSRQSRLYDRLAAGPLGVVTLDAHAEPDALARAVLSRVGSVLDGR